MIALNNPDRVLSLIINCSFAKMDRIHQADSVLGEELGRIRSLGTIGAAGAAVVEGEHPMVLGIELDLAAPA